MEERERRPEEKIAEVGGVRFPQPSLIFPVRAGGRQKSGGVDRSLGAVRLGDPVLDMRAAAFGVISHLELSDVAGDDPRPDRACRFRPGRSKGSAPS